MRTASTAAKPCQEDSSEFYLITGSIYTDQRGTVRILKDGGEGMSMSVQCHKYHKMAKSQDDETRLCLVDDLKVLKITLSQTSQDKGTSSSLKSKITTTIHKLKIEVKDYELRTKDKA
ncbi:hypothetical protein Tco_0548367 [Tanacetum coccineum]